jgi:hypothetical protein
MMSIFQRNESFIETFSPTYFSSDVSRPLMLGRLTNLDIIVIDAAVITGLPGERARRLVENRSHVAPHNLPKLLITVHSESEKLCAQRAIGDFKPFVASVEVRWDAGQLEGVTLLIEADGGMKNLQYTAEALVLQPRFATLFTEEERKKACRRLKDLDSSWPC